MGSVVVERGRAEPLTFYPPWNDLAQPTAADIRVGTPSVTMPEEGSETACTVDTVSTTLSTSGTRGASTLTVASAVGIVAGRRYLLTYLGARLVVTVRAVVSSTLHLAEPLPVDVPTGAAVSGIAVTTSLTTTQTATLGMGHVVLRMTLNGVVRRFDYELRVEPRKFPLLLTPEDCLSSSEIRRHRPAHDPSLEDTIRDAWELELRPRLRARGILEHRITSPGEVKRPHYEAVVLRILRASDAPTDRVTDQELRLKRTIDDMLASREYWYSEEATVDARTDERQHLQPTEYIRLMR